MLIIDTPFYNPISLNEIIDCDLLPNYDAEGSPRQLTTIGM